MFSPGVSVILNPGDGDSIKPIPQPSCVLGAQENKILKKLMLVAPFFGLQVYKWRY